MKKTVSNKSDVERIRAWRAAHPEEARAKSREDARKRRERIPDVVRAQDRERRREVRAENPEKYRESQRNWRAKNPDRSKELSRNWRAKNPDYQKHWREKNREKVRKIALESYYRNREKCTARAHRANIKKKYGLTMELYAAIIAAQGGGCGICGRASQIDGRRLHIDHCHDSRIVRGVLCSECNVLLGRIEKLGDWMKRADLYLANPPALAIVKATAIKVDSPGFHRMLGSRWGTGQFGGKSMKLTSVEMIRADGDRHAGEHYNLPHDEAERLIAEGAAKLPGEQTPVGPSKTQEVGPKETQEAKPSETKDDGPDEEEETPITHLESPKPKLVEMNKPTKAPAKTAKTKASARRRG